MSLEDALADTTASLRDLRIAVTDHLLEKNGHLRTCGGTCDPDCEAIRRALGDNSVSVRFLGQAGVRDPDHPCAEFSPGSPTDGGCDGDGHYLCFRCVLHHEERTP